MAKERIIQFTTRKETLRRQSLSQLRKGRIPSINPYSIPRPRLFEQLNEGLKYRAILVTAPAGFGKTTLVAQWLKDKNLQILWFSIGQDDNDPKMFWNHIYSGLASETSLMNTLDFSIDRLLEMISQLSQKSILVLDNFNFITESSIHGELAALISYLPEKLHIVVISRSFPPPQLALLKGKGYYKAISAEHLSFNKGEIASYFTKKDMKLNGDEINMLKQLSEGWAAGLDLAATFLDQNEKDIYRFMDSIDWENEPLAAYFNEQITQVLSPEAEEFLLQTSILEDMNGDLCNTITGQNDGKSILTQFYQKGLLLYLQDKRSYRCHHLFKLYLYSLLKQKGDGRLTILHRVVGQWYLERGLTSKAIRHFLQAGDYGNAVFIMEKQGAKILQNGDIDTILYFCSMVPDGRIERHPVVHILIAWAYALNYQMAEAEKWLTRAEKFGESEKNKSLLLRDYHRLKGEIVLVRLKINTYNFKKMRALIDEAFQQLGEESSSIIDRGMTFNNNLRLLFRVKNLYWPGRLDEIKTTVEWIPYVERLGKGVLAGWLVTLHGEIAYELNNLEEARRQLLQGVRSAEKSEEIGILIPGLLNLSRIRWAEKDRDYTFELLDEAAKKARKFDHRWLPIIEAYRVRLWLEEGKIDPGIKWMENSHYTIYDELSLAKEYEYITLARMLMALGKYSRVKFLLERLLILAHEEKVYLSIIELLNLMAIVHAKNGREEEALETLKEALSIGEEDNLVRVYIDEGKPLLQLLERFELKEKQNETVDYKLIEFVKSIRGETTPYKQTESEFICVEELSLREIEVLQLLKDGLSNHEVAEMLSISIPTVKSHVRSIFRKLDVKNRTQAVARGRDLKILL